MQTYKLLWVFAAMLGNAYIMCITMFPAMCISSEKSTTYILMQEFTHVAT